MTLVILLAFIEQPAAFAHPHAHIDVEVEVRFDDAGRVVALHQNWLLDGPYSAYVSKGLALASGNATPRQLESLAATMLGNLARFHYLTHLESYRRELALSAPLDAVAAFRGRRLELGFTLPLAEPANVREAPLTYSVYDPSYYIEMLHGPEKGAIRLSGAPPDCRAILRPPHPDPAKVQAAAALDRTQNGGDFLGAFFAERVILRCGVAR